MADYRVGFRSADTEHDAVDLPVEGELPDWLSGALVRNGPGKFEAGEPGDGEQFAHWFDGLALLRRFGFDDGSVELTTRFLRTEEYRAVVEEGRLGAGQFGTDAGGSLLARLEHSVSPASTDNANVNVMRAGGDFLALTPGYAVIAACPLVIDLWRLLRPGGHDTFLDALDWRSERPTRFVVVSRDSGT